MYDELKEKVCIANIELCKKKLVIYSWGNVSGIDRSASVIAIKPSGVSYDQLTPDKIVVLDLGGKIVEGDLKPSSDTPTHLQLYRNFNGIGGICHTHSTYATMWAQACKEIPCLGTTHADFFYGPVPVTDVMTEDEINSFLQGTLNLHLGTVDEKGEPNIQPVWFHHDTENQKIFFSTYADSKKMENMQKNLLTKDRKLQATGGLTTMLGE